MSVPGVVDALEDAFSLAFGNVRAAGTRHLLGLDVAGSMTVGTAGRVPGLTPNMAAAMSLVALRTEPEALTMGFARGFRRLGITPGDTLEAAMRKPQDASIGPIDCARPMRWAAQERVKVDTFVVDTDNETWAG